MEFQLPETNTYLSDDSVDQMLELAERLKAVNGGELDDSAIQAVAEATGAPVEYVRLAVKIKTEKEKGSFLANLRTQYHTLEPHTRRFVVSGFAAAMCAFFADAGMKAHNLHSYWAGEFLQIISLVWVTLGLFNCCTARDSRTAAIVGALFAGGFFTGYEVFGLLLGLGNEQAPSAVLLFPITLGGALAGIVLNKVTEKYRGALGLKDPVSERQEMLRQLQQLQDKLKSGEQIVTFLSVDIVGSTKMKQLVDPLDVEYTFNEYHQFVSRIARKHSGRVHSTAGDGVTCAFENPQSAFAAARNISAGLLELNSFRNKIGVPICLRQGIHTGKIITPESGDIQNVSFAHVIDVASHLQKVAPEGTIAVSDSSARYLAGGAAAIGTDRIVASDVEATIFFPRTVAATGNFTPPPIPGRA